MGLPGPMRFSHHPPAGLSAEGGPAARWLPVKPWVMRMALAPSAARRPYVSKASVISGSVRPRSSVKSRAVNLRSVTARSAGVEVIWPSLLGRVWTASMTRASSLGQMGRRGLRRASEHALHHGPKRARRIARCPGAAPGDMPVGADEHGTLVADLVRALPRVVGVGERAAGADRVGDEGRVGRPGELLRRRAPGIAAAAGQQDEAEAEEID